MSKTALNLCKFRTLCLILFTILASALLGQAATLSGELKTWHPVNLTIDGPEAAETDTAPNPFLDYRFDVLFYHESGTPALRVPGYFAADGRAEESGATSGNKWRVHLNPDKAGTWRYEVIFLKGPEAAINLDAKVEAVTPAHGQSGSFQVKETDKTGRDFRARGRLAYNGTRYLRHSGSGEYFLKFGPDAPETLLAYTDFDGTEQTIEKGPLKTWAPHAGDWKAGDPVWHGSKGKGLIGALNYLAEKGCNSLSFLTYNAGGDGDNVWPFVSRDNPLHYDISKLAQWGLVFDHAQELGLLLHVKLQETENDDQRWRREREYREIPEALDGGQLGPERKLYFREMVARFSHLNAIEWNLGEENTQTSAEQAAQAAWLASLDPYHHHRVIHTYPGDQDKVYNALLGPAHEFTGASLQNPWDAVHRRTLGWIRASAEAGRPWVVANDEQGPADLGVPPDPEFIARAGTEPVGELEYDLHDIRKFTLWGNLMAGGAGVMYYFGYKLPENDLLAEDFRSRDRSWDFGRIALSLFHEHAIPFWNMENANALVGNPDNANGPFCLTDTRTTYLVYLPTGQPVDLDLTGVTGSFSVKWLNPRSGGMALIGSVSTLKGDGIRGLGLPPTDPDQDWVVLLNRKMN
jgi:hypothetical protein